MKRMVKQAIKELKMLTIEYDELSIEVVKAKDEQDFVKFGDLAWKQSLIKDEIENLEYKLEEV